MRIKRVASIGSIAFVAALVACGTSAHESSNESSIGASESPLQAGVFDTDTTWVVGMVNEHYGTICTGVLIAPNLVLTTRHCVDWAAKKNVECGKTDFPSETAADSLSVATCADIQKLGASANCDWHRAARIFRPSNPQFCGNDVALLLLSAPIPASQATPAIPRLSPLLQNGERSVSTFSVVGYGSINTARSDWGTRRRLNELDLTCIASPADCSSVVYGAPVLENEFATSTPGVCDGDSGGPAIVVPNGRPEVVGIASRGAMVGNECGSSIFARIDPWGSWIVAVAKEAAKQGNYATPSWALSRRNVGETCSTDDECAFSACRGSPLRCVQPCEGVFGSCTKGVACESGSCALPPPPPAADDGCQIGHSRSSSAVGWILVGASLLLTRLRPRRRR